MNNIDESKVESYYKFYKWAHISETKYQSSLEYYLKYRAEAAKRYFETGEEKDTEQLKEIVEHINLKIKELLAL